MACRVRNDVVARVGNPAVPLLGASIYAASRTHSLRFCNLQKQPAQKWDGVIAGHSYLESRTEIVDFSCGDWRAESRTGRWDVEPLFDFV